MNDSSRQLKHLLLRAGFGPQASQWNKIRNQSPESALRKLLKASQPEKGKKERNASFSSGEPKQGPKSPAMRKMSQQKNRRKIKELNIGWIQKMVSSEDQLREKMTLFWHDHFACRLNAAPFAERQIQTLRHHALGSFRDLLFAISRDPGMLQFLSNQQNKKAHPNENFARELLELFTLGRGNYREQDIQEAARAFTGWGFNAKGEFVFRTRQHDEGRKTFLGESGNFAGEDILKILLAQPRTARFLTEKIYRYFVHPEINEAQVEAWSQAFFASDYDIRGLLELIFSSKHFYEERNIGARIKSPIEYLVGIMRQLDLKLNDEEGLLIIQKVLGQVLLQPPNVAGWPDGRAWIDSSTLMMRLRIPQALLLGKDVQLEARAHFAGNEDGFQMKGHMVRKLEAEVDWDAWQKPFRKQAPEAITDTLREYFLQIEAPHLNWEQLAPMIPADAEPEIQLRFLMARLIGTPEFQLC